MAYDEFLGDRIRQVLMGGLCFKVDEKMLCGIHIDKKFGDSLLMARIGEDAYEEQIQKPNCLPMDFTGRPMKGYIFATPLGFDSDDDLAYWIDQCLAFNPLAKASKKKKKV
jgi:hypothetical protein